MTVPGDDHAAPETLSSAERTAPVSPSREQLAPLALRTALGTLTGFALVALTNALAIAWSLPRPAGGIGLRLAHHVFDAAETIGLGAVDALVIGLWLRFVGLPVWAAALVQAAVAAPIMFAIIGSDLYRQASVAFDGRLETPLFVTFVVLCALAVPAAQVIGTLLSRFRWLWWIPAFAALVAMVGNHLLLTDDYFGVHGTVTWTAATLAGAALGPRAARLHAWLQARRGGRAAMALIAAVAALGVLVPPSNQVRFELFREPCSLAWALAATVWRAPSPHDPAAAPAPSALAWAADRSALPPVPPTRPALLPRSPVVVLITVDALRADAINGPDNDDLLPTFRELKRAGVFFTRATSPGSQTAVSLTSAFSSRYFSELFWSMHGKGSSRFAYAAEDPAPRFPQLLSDQGVRTGTYCSINFLAGEFGVTRGFQDEEIIAKGRGHAQARQVIDPLLERLRRAATGPLFLYAHLTEPHAPYDRGKREGSNHERYLSEVAVADAQIGRVLSLLKQRFSDRGILIVSSDHGEAFGEHGTEQHTKTLYEELLRVPLLFHGPRIAPRALDVPVGLIDLGPTILDLFGLATPASYLGQSLVPWLRGGQSELTRPLLAEGRLRRALYFGDRLKVIDDPRRKLVEVYDLSADPGELVNLFDRDPARADPGLTGLRAFFAARTLARDGYRPPYKP